MVKDQLRSRDTTRIFLLSALLLLSWWSTTQGIFALIAAGNSTPSLVIQLSIGTAIAILTLLISWTLDRLRSGRTGNWAPLFLLGYLLLTGISVGFGYGFYWTHIEARSSAQRTAEAQVDQVSRRLSTIYAQLEDSLSALDAVVLLSQQRAAQEATEGGTCDLPMGAGQGPRYTLRTQDAQRMATIRDRLVRQVGRDDINANNIRLSTDTLLDARTQLDRHLATLSPSQFAEFTPERARRTLAATETALLNTHQKYEAVRTGSAMQSAITTLDQRILLGRGNIDLQGTIFQCTDPELDILMQQARDNLASLPAMQLPALEVPLGADATVFAFEKLANTALWPLTRNTDKALMTGRDAIPFAIAVAVDLFILLLSVTGASAFARNQQNEQISLLDDPERLLSLMGSTTTSETPHIELLEHTFWWRGAYHLAVPLDGPGEGPLTPAQRGLALAAMVLTDQGYLTPVNSTGLNSLVRKKLHARFGRYRSRPIRAQYDVYHIEEAGLAKLTSRLVHQPASDVSAKQIASTPVRTDYRLGIKPVKAASSGRPSPVTPKHKGTDASTPAPDLQPVKKGVRPSAFWRGLWTSAKNRLG